MTHWGCPGPIKHGRQWLDATLRPFLDPEKFDFLARLKWCKRSLLFFWTQSKQQIALATCRGKGEAMQSFVAVASIRWKVDLWQAAELWLLTTCKGGGR